MSQLCWNCRGIVVRADDELVTVPVSSAGLGESSDLAEIAEEQSRRSQ